jgi:hypothetical protein
MQTGYVIPQDSPNGSVFCISEFDLADSPDIQQRFKQLDKAQGAVDHRLEKIDENLIGIGQDIAAIKVTIQPKTLHWAISGLVLPLTVVVVVAVVTALFHIELTIPRMARDIESIGKSVGDLHRVQAATSLNSAEQEAKTGQLSDAKVQVEQSTVMLQKARTYLAPAPTSFFQQYFDQLNSLSAAGVDKTDIHQALVQLASYRSALQPEPPKLASAQWRVITSPLGIDEIAVQLGKQGGTVIQATTSDIKVIAPTGNSANLTVTDIVFVGGRQELDGITWARMTFVGTKISLHGKYPASLDKVSFVNCTFEVPNDPKSVPLLEYAALSQSGELKLTPFVD